MGLCSLAAFARNHAYKLEIWIDVFFYWMSKEFEFFVVVIVVANPFYMSGYLTDQDYTVWKFLYVNHT